jgi:hypothetical protein
MFATAVTTGACVATMLSFVDTKFFGAAFTGAGTLATGYVADASDWRLIALPLLAMTAYYLVFFEARGGWSRSTQL